MSAVLLPYVEPDPTKSNDRFGWALLLALLVHAIIIFGVKFELFDTRPLKDMLPSMEIILVNKADQKPVTQPDYLANVDRQGGGNLPVETVSPRPPPVAAPVPVPEPNPAPPTVEPSLASPEPVPEILTALPDAVTEPEPLAQVTPLPLEEIEQEILVIPAPSQKTSAAANTSKPVVPETAPPERVEKTPSAAELITSGMEIASLSSQINDSIEAYSARPKQKFISAKTQQYRYAAYMEAWRLKVERVGNLNYPQQAKDKNLSGSLLLDVAINADGSINNVALLRSSGEKALDDAAIGIVKLASPYAPFSTDIRKETDILHITRTWQFLPGNRLSSR